MVTTSTETKTMPARAAAIAVFGSIGATLLGIVVAQTISTEIGGVVGFAGAALALIVATRGLGVLEYLSRLDALPAAATSLYLLGGLIPASLGISILPGVSIDDIPTIVASAMAAQWLIGWRSSTPLPRLLVPLLGLIAWAIVAWIFASPSLKILLVGPGRWSIYALMLLVGVQWFRSPRLRWWALGVLIALSLGQALISVWSYHADWLIDGMYIGIEKFRWYQPLSEVVNGRTTGLLGISSNFFGAYSLIPALASLGVAAYANQRWMRAAMVAAYAVIAYAGILSYTRATLIGLILGLIGFLIMVRPVRLIPLVVAITALVVLATPIVSRFHEGNDRAALASQAGESIFHNPVIGVGSGSYVDGDPTDLEEEGAPTVTPHNSFLLQTSETGLLGGILLAASVLALLASVWGGAIPRSSGAGIVATAVFAGLGAVLIQTMSNNLLHIPPVATQFWLVGAVGATFAADAGGRWSRYLLSPVWNRSAT